MTAHDRSEFEERLVRLRPRVSAVLDQRPLWPEGGAKAMIALAIG